MGNIFLHADDYGLTRGISDSLDKLIEKEKINSISIIVNGYEEYDLKLNKDVRIASHINIFENKPISNENFLKDILDKNGRFRESFTFYLFSYYLGSTLKRKKIRNQIQIEVESQLIKLNKALKGDQRINSIDSHNHIHMIPYIFNIFIEVCLKYDIKNIRTAHEFFDFSFPKNNLFKFNFYVGIIKHVLLNSFTFLNNRKVKKNNLLTNKYYLGVLFSGRMSKELIDSPINKIKHNLKDNDYIEIVLHPGILEKDEYKYWENSPSLAKFYSSMNRKDENITLNNINNESYKI